MFHFVSLRKGLIYMFSPKLLVNNRADWVLSLIKAMNVGNSEWKPALIHLKIDYVTSCSFFLLITTRLGFLDWATREYRKVRKNFMHCIFGTDSDLCLHHLSVWSNFSLLHNSRWLSSHLHKPSSVFILVPFDIFAYKWFTFSYLSPHSLYLIFSYILSVFSFT